MELVIPEPSSMDAESDEDLLLYIEEGNEIEHRQAANAFFRRYVSQLYGFCNQYNVTLGGDSGVCDLVSRTFQLAFKRAETFDSSGIVDQERSHARTFRWLSTMATNLVRDWLKSSNENYPLPLTTITNRDRQYVRLSDEATEKNLARTALREFERNNDDLLPTISANEQCLEEALATLMEREKEIVLLSAKYSVDRKQLRLPPDILKGLCGRWETTKENVRTIRKRALDKIRTYMATNCQKSS